MAWSRTQLPVTFILRGRVRVTVEGKKEPGALVEAQPERDFRRGVQAASVIRLSLFKLLLHPAAGIS